MLLAASIFWVYASPAWAAEGNMAQSGCPEIMASIRPDDMSGLVGALVLDQHNEELGRVVDVSGSHDGGIDFLIVSSCLPGMDGQLVAIPYRSFNYLPREMRSVTLNLSMEDFKNAPSFSADSWPNGVSSTNWGEKAYRYFEKTQYFG